MRGLRDTPVLKRIFEEGKQEGKAEGKAEGKLEGKVETLATIVHTRLGRPSASLSRKIAAVKDEVRLRELVELALQADSLAEFQKRAFPRPVR
jgi:predicted transposase YdaD